MDEFAYRHAVLRASGRTMTNAIIIPISKTDEWWKMTTLERHAYFYPHSNTDSKQHASGSDARGALDRHSGDGIGIKEPAVTQKRPALGRGLSALISESTIPPMPREETKVKGHALAAEAGISTIFRRLYHNPDGYHRQKEYDFIAYFECANEHLAVFDEIRTALRDKQQNPEWKFVIEGPKLRGRRVLKW